MLTTEQLSYVEMRLANEKKSLGVAYVLLIFLGVFGVHRIYLEKGGWFLLICSILSAFAIGIIVSIIDLFLLPGIVRSDTQVRRERLMAVFLKDRSNQ